MKNGTAYAKKIKKAYAKFRGTARGDSLGSHTPVEQLILGILSQETSFARAEQALRRILDDMVDYNELRVSTPAEVSASISKHVPRSVQRSKSLLMVLNAIYQLEYTITLDHLASRGVREIKAYLQSLHGITPYAMASVMLWSLGAHAIPINDVALEFLRENDLVDGGATGAEVQSFLERHINAADAKAFCLDLDAAIGSNIFAGNGKAKSPKSPKSAKAAASPTKKASSSKPATKSKKKAPVKTKAVKKKSPAKKATAKRK
ncbi:MAG: hypothetical protein GXP29_12195 [Planctomycetes bacterium]|nr:hypothetical protein [Planctomycetota bacterium]